MTMAARACWIMPAVGIRELCSLSGVQPTASALRPCQGGLPQEPRGPTD